MGSDASVMPPGPGIEGCTGIFSIDGIGSSMYSSPLSSASSSCCGGWATDADGTAEPDAKFQSLPASSSTGQTKSLTLS